MKFLILIGVVCFSFTAFSQQDDRDGVVITSCQDAVEVANNLCALWDDPDYGDGDDDYDLTCFDKFMNQYGYEYWTDYRTESKGRAHPIYNKFVCN